MDLREMELRDTVEMMNNADYKERFKAEYYQTAIRYGKLKAMVDKHNNGTLEFKPTCPMSIYDIQLSKSNGRHMGIKIKVNFYLNLYDWLILLISKTCN